MANCTYLQFFRFTYSSKQVQKYIAFSEDEQVSASAFSNITIYAHMIKNYLWSLTRVVATEPVGISPADESLSKRPTYLK